MKLGQAEPRCLPLPLRQHWRWVAGLAPAGLPCEHTFSMTAEAHAHVRFRRAIERRALWAAEDAARELPNLRLEEALQLVHLYAEKDSPKFEAAARRWLGRYLDERRPCLLDFAQMAATLAQRQPP
jgi:hypothetical protein